MSSLGLGDSSSRSLFSSSDVDPVDADMEEPGVLDVECLCLDFFAVTGTGCRVDFVDLDLACVCCSSSDPESESERLEFLMPINQETSKQGMQGPCENNGKKRHGRI
jgi:hypothetical protein